MSVEQGPTILADALVRVWGPGDEVVGAGFLVGPGLVATCAHVVADALGTDPYAREAPARLVRLDFPLAGADLPVNAEVAEWVPIGEDGTGDLALLRLRDDQPAAARMPPLRRVDRLWGHRFLVLGYPEGQADGVWSTGTICGEQGIHWYQLQSAPSEQRIEGGFSGAPVWDAESGAVVGMTVAASRGEAPTAYLIPIDQVLGLDPELLPCPYQGLRPFEEEHRELFHGRDEEIERLVEAVAQLPVVAVAGPSGVGKSSLVRAGLLPRLRDRGLRIVDFRATPGADNVAALTAALTTALPDEPSVVVIDQFEELASVDPDGAGELLGHLLGLTRQPESRVRGVLTVRWTALDELDPDVSEALVAGTVLVSRLDRPRLRDAIVRPAERAPGLAFEAGLVERILDDAGTEPGQLPLVESLLADLWEHREGGVLTLRGYFAAGGVAGAVAQHAEKVVRGIDGAIGQAGRRLFTALAQPDRDGRFVRRAMPVEQLPAEQRFLVPKLVRGRLLVQSRAADGLLVVELAHQALVEHWPRLREWLVADRDFLAWRSRLDDQRERWENDGRDDGSLLRGSALAAAGEWLPVRGEDLSAPAREYVRRSEVRQRREIRRWRMGTAVLAVAVVAAAALAALAVNRGNDLAARLASANAETLAREAEARAPTDRSTAVQLALAAWRSDPANPRARTVLAGSYLALQSAEATFPNLTDTPSTS